MTIPDGWVWSTLDNCVEILDNRRVPVNSDEREKRIAGKDPSSLIPYYGATGFVGWIDDYIFDEEIVLLGEDGAPFLDSRKDKAYIVRGKSWVNNHAHVLKAIVGVTSNAFIMHYLNFFEYHDYVTGTTRLKLNQSRMREIPIPLPPIPEQERIVARIEELFTQLDAGVVSLRRVKAALKRYKAIVLKAAVEGRLRNGKSGIEDEELPEGWRWTTFGEISNMITKGSSPNWQGFEYQENGITFVRSQNIGWGNLELVSLVYLPPEFNQKEKKSVIHKGDVLLNIVGASIGRCAKATSAIEGGNLNQAVAIIRLKQELAEPDYVVNYLLTPDAQHKINLEKVDVARANISLADIRDILIPLPSLDEQRRIVVEVERRLSVAAQVEAAAEAGLKRAERLRQAILKRAFEGRLVG